MSETVLSAFINAGLALLAAILSLVAVWITNHTRKKAEEAKEKIEALHIQINSRFDELLRLTAEVAHAKGLAEGAAGERNRSTIEVQMTSPLQLKEKSPDAA